MKLRLGFDGLVDGGVECAVRRNHDYEIDKVYDLTDWIRRQFVALRREAEASEDKEASSSIWIDFDSSHMPFGRIQATTSRYIAMCFHPETKPNSSLESADLNKVTSFLVEKARSVSELRWKPRSHSADLEPPPLIGSDDKI
jgi:hypothetical protein